MRSEVTYIKRFVIEGFGSSYPHLDHIIIQTLDTLFRPVTVFTSVFIFTWWEIYLVSRYKEYHKYYDTIIL